jgi:hypothetical protein
MDIVMPKLRSTAEETVQETDMASNAMISKNGSSSGMFHTGPEMFELGAQ